LIVDSSAILAIFLREPGAEELLSAILDAGVTGIGAPTAAETGLVLTSRFEKNATGLLLRFFEETRIEILPFTISIGSERWMPSGVSARAVTPPR
jgi:ribonuclease VapC